MAGWKKAAVIAVVAAAVLCVAVWQLQPSLEPEAEPAEPPLIYVESTGEEVTPVERTVGEGIEREMLPVVTLTAAEDSLFLYVPEQFQDTVQVEEEYYHQIGQGQLEIRAKCVSCCRWRTADGSCRSSAEGMPPRRRITRSSTATRSISTCGWITPRPDAPVR